ncbi:GTP-binding protein [Deferribacterales bacterium RsTz2092]|nr:GTPase [Deferribacterales bacterium]
METKLVNLDMSKFSPEAVQLAIKKMLGEQKIPNVLICGQTGVGKSSVVNYIFNETVAEAGTGKPCTKDITLYPSDTVNIYDSEGYELGSDKQTHYEQLIFDDFLLKHKDVRAEDAVHLVWYAISAAGKRITPLDIELINRIKGEGFHVCVLLTKVDELDESQLNDMLATANKELAGVKVFRLSIHVKDTPALAPFCDWAQLVEWSYEQLPNVFRTRYVVALNGEWLEQKHSHANSAINNYVIASGATASIPIPFADAPVLVGIQTAMLIKLAGIYGIEISGAKRVMPFLLNSVVAKLGKTLAGYLLKLIPGLGNLLGGLLNASVAAAITYGLGKAFSEVCYRQRKGAFNGETVTFDVEKMLESKSFLDDVTRYFKEKNGKQ